MKPPPLWRPHWHGPSASADFCSNPTRHFKIMSLNIKNCTSRQTTTSCERFPGRRYHFEAIEAEAGKKESRPCLALWTSGTDRYGSSRLGWPEGRGSNERMPVADSRRQHRNGVRGELACKGGNDGQVAREKEGIGSRGGQNALCAAKILYVRH